MLCLGAMMIDLMKVNMSIAVIPLATELGMSLTEVGEVSSYFFWGYMATQIPAASIANAMGSSRATGCSLVLAVGLAVMSLGTAAAALLRAPLVAGGPAALRFLAMTRLVVGLGCGLSPAAAGGIVALVPALRRDQAMGVYQAGFAVGPALGMLVGPAMVASRFGWPSLFWLFGLFGCLWTAVWLVRFRALERALDLPSPAKAAEAQSGNSSPRPSRIPWKHIFSNVGVLVLIVSHSFSNASFYALLAWVPTWYCSDLGFSVSRAGMLTCLAFVGQAIVSLTVGKAASLLLQRGVATKVVRRCFQGVGFFGSALCSISVALAGLLGFSPAVQAALISVGVTIHACNRAGMCCTYADLSPRHAASLWACSTSFGAVAGLTSVWGVGALIDATGGSFHLGLFAPVAISQVVAGLVYCTMSRHRRQDFDQL